MAEAVLRLATPPLPPLWPVPLPIPPVPPMALDVEVAEPEGSKLVALVVAVALPPTPPVPLPETVAALPPLPPVAFAVEDTPDWSLAVVPVSALAAPPAPPSLTPPFPPFPPLAVAELLESGPGSLVAMVGLGASKPEPEFWSKPLLPVTVILEAPAGSAAAREMAISESLGVCLTSPA